MKYLLLALALLAVSSPCIAQPGNPPPGSGTGGGTPGGSSGQIQYNNAGSFAGAANSFTDGTKFSFGGNAAPIGSATFQIHKGTNINLGVLQGTISAALGAFINAYNDAGGLIPFGMNATAYNFSTGNVGISTTTPGSLLDVNGSTPATNTANSSSGAFRLTGSIWNGAATPDYWSLQNVVASTGTNPVSTLSLTHSGSTGLAWFNPPTGIQVGNAAIGGGAGMWVPPSYYFINSGGGSILLSAINSSLGAVQLGTNGSVGATSGNVIGVLSQATANPPSGTANYANTEIRPTLNGTSTGTAYGLVIDPVVTAWTGGTVKLISAGTTTTNYGSGYTEVFNVAQNGTVRMVNTFTVATLPTCNAGAQGTMTAVTDGSSPAYLTTVTGGGAVYTPVVCNGANWVAH